MKNYTDMHITSGKIKMVFVEKSRIKTRGKTKIVQKVDPFDIVEDEMQDQMEDCGENNDFLKDVILNLPAISTELPENKSII
jgi:hypothetical protein